MSLLSGTTYAERRRVNSPILPSRSFRVLRHCPIVLGALCVAPLQAADAPTASATPPPAANYTDTPRVEHYSGSTPYFAPPPTSWVPWNSWHNHPFGGGNWHSLGGTTVTIRRPDVIFFPPTIPALGDRVPASVPVQRGQPLPPPELAAYVHEIFMPQLGTLLFHNDLPKKWRIMVEDYRARRDAATDELRAQIEAARLLEPQARAAALNTFAQQQESTLQALEAEAERIRETMTEGTWRYEGSNWNSQRSWRLGDDIQWESNADELRVIRAAIFYSEGFSPEQRDLLREMTRELLGLLEDPLGEIKLSAPATAVSFLPAAARLRLPPELPPEVQARLDRFVAAKAELKRELRDEIYAQDRAWFVSRRTQAFRTLAERQAPRFAALQAEAEELRRAFAAIPGITPGEIATALPAALVDRINAYLQSKTDLQDTLTRKLQDLRHELPFDRVEFGRVDTGYGIVVLPGKKTRKSRRLGEIEAELKQFNEIQVARYNALNREIAAIQAEVHRVAEAALANTRHRTLAALLREFEENVQVQHRWGLYRDYQDATLLPGLSPSQRRLLFSAGVNRLMLPLLNAQR